MNWKGLIPHFCFGKAMPYFVIHSGRWQTRPRFYGVMVGRFMLGWWSWKFEARKRIPTVTPLPKPETLGVVVEFDVPNEHGHPWKVSVYGSNTSHARKTIASGHAPSHADAVRLSDFAVPDGTKRVTHRRARMSGNKAWRTEDRT